MALVSSEQSKASPAVPSPLMSAHVRAVAGATVQHSAAVHGSVAQVMPAGAPLMALVSPEQSKASSTVPSPLMSAHVRAVAPHKVGSMPVSVMVYSCSNVFVAPGSTNKAGGKVSVIVAVFAPAAAAVAVILEHIIVCKSYVNSNLDGVVILAILSLDPGTTAAASEFVSVPVRGTYDGPRLRRESSASSIINAPSIAGQKCR